MALTRQKGLVTSDKWLVIGRTVVLVLVLVLVLVAMQ